VREHCLRPLTRRDCPATHAQLQLISHFIALSQTTAPNTTITLLLGYLDTFYTDPAGWSLLAELYADQGLYAQSLAALGHVMLINTWDSIAVCRAGETAYTMGCVDKLSC
jgi:predicted Zn-dependent protease